MFKIGNVLKHHSGNVYIVIEIANETHSSEKFPVTVVYRGANGNVWARKLSDMIGKFSILYDGSNKAE